MPVSTETTRDGGGGVGLATLLALLLSIAGLWHGVSFLGQPAAKGVSGATTFWLLADLAGGILSCALIVIYLRHLFRTVETSPTRSAWRLAILLFGPFAMPVYWWAYMRRASYWSSQTLDGQRLTPEEARLLASLSAAPPGPTETP